MNTVVSQALATGLPVVTTRHSGLPEQVQPGINGALVDEGDVEALAECLVRLVQHPKLIETWSAGARDYVKARYDAPPLIERQIAFYTQVARR